MKTLNSLSLAIVVTAVLAGCVTQSVVVEKNTTLEPVPPPAVVDAHFEGIAGRGPDVIASLRAEPAPVRPEIVEGKNFAGDQSALNARGFVHVGSGRYAVDDASADRESTALGTNIGADRIVIYREHLADDASQPEFMAAYFVRFKLLFGATFRNLTNKEREAVAGAGGVEIGSVVGSTPAAQANLIAGDLVLMFNGKPFRDRVEFQELLRSQAGKPVTLTIRRNELTMDRVVRLGAMPPTAGER